MRVSEKKRPIIKTRIEERKGIQNTTTGNFSSLIGNGKKNIAPKFQRDYSWDTEQWDDLWQDIDSMILNKGDHYMGYLVLNRNNDGYYKEYLVKLGELKRTKIAATEKLMKRCFEWYEGELNEADSQYGC